MKKMWFVFVLVIGAAALRAQIIEEPEVAFKLSNESQKPLLMIFSGSDWCAPCVRLNDTD